MPTICKFLGMIITMYWDEHPPPHFHVKHGNYRAIIDILTGSIIKGKLPKSALKPLEEWRILHNQELLDNWNRREQGKPVLKIKPLEGK